MNEARYREAERRLWESVGVTPTEQRVHLGATGVTVRVQEVGQGPAVVFVHGASNSGASWAPLVARLDGFRYIALRTAAAHPDRIRRMVEFGWTVGAPIARVPLVMRLASVPMVGRLLAKIHTPVHFLWGEEDPFGGADIARQFVRHLPNAELELLPGAGHAVWIDDPDHAATTTRRFLREG